jgi:hypothetical protein
MGRLAYSEKRLDAATINGPPGRHHRFVMESTRPRTTRILEWFDDDAVERDT